MLWTYKLLRKKKTTTHDSPGHEVAQLFGPSKLSHRWLGKRNRTLCIFPRNERFFISCCFTKKRPRTKTGIVLFYPVSLHYHLLGEWREGRLTLDFWHLTDLEEKWSYRTAALLSSHPHSSPPPFCLCPSRQATLCSGLFPLATCKAWSHYQPRRTFLGRGLGVGWGGQGIKPLAAFPAVGNSSFSHEPWLMMGEGLGYNNTCPASQGCCQYEMT